MTTLLTMYSSSNSVFPMRRKAGNEFPGVIDQPCLVVFGTAIPKHYYEALSERMLTNGFFARMIVLEAGPRGTGQEPSIIDLPDRVLATAKWWADYRPGTGNLEDSHPVPTVIEHSDEARRLLIETRELAEAEYSAAQSRHDSVGTTVWGRVSEQIRKLALLYAISEDHQSPNIGLTAVQWASAFVMHQVRRMLFMAADHVAENPFHADCLKLMRRAAGVARTIDGAQGTHAAHALESGRFRPDRQHADDAGRHRARDHPDQDQARTGVSTAMTARRIRHMNPSQGVTANSTAGTGKAENVESASDLSRMAVTDSGSRKAKEYKYIKNLSLPVYVSVTTPLARCACACTRV